MGGYLYGHGGLWTWGMLLMLGIIPAVLSKVYIGGVVWIAMQYFE